jgi:hypothetical protein
MVLVVATEKITIRLPAGFDPARHLRALESKIAEKHGDGFLVDSIDPAAGVAYASRQVAVTEVSSGSGSRASAGTKEVRLPRGTKPSDGDRVAARLADQHPGYAMVTFEPFLGRAVLARMDERVQRARDAVAVALGSKPWDVGISPRPDGGFDLTLPNRYMPSKHDDKLAEVATAVIGKDGWYVDVDPQALRGSIIPGDPPTFPPVVEYPFARPPAFDPAEPGWSRIPLGVTLGRTGIEPGPELVTDFVLCPGMSIQGTTGSGKGLTLMALMTGALARGWELAICDAIKGGVDFVQWQPFVRPSGWGDDLPSACAVLHLIYQEGVSRKARIKHHRVQKWTELPASEGVRPIMVVVDELTSLIAPEPVPKGVPKDNPLYLEVAERNLLRATILNVIGKIARELRFAGVSVVAATQVASTTTGVPTELRSNLGAKILLGAKPTDNNRRLALNNPDAVPTVPANIAASKDGASRGTGVFEFEGTPPGVVKVHFATPDRYAAWLADLGVPTTDRPHPTPTEIAAHTPHIDAGTSDAGTSRRRVEPVLDPDTGEELHGFARANEQRRRLNRKAEP